MKLEKLKNIVRNLGGKQIYIKKLSPNDNSKNQVYLAGSFDFLNIFPVEEIIADSSGDWKRQRFKAKINFGWVQEDGIISVAPRSQFILYPKYPEVRFSGFLAGCRNAPSELMNQRLQDRLLFLSKTETGQIVGYISSPDSTMYKEYLQIETDGEYGVFKIINLIENQDTKAELINEFKRIHDLGWIDSKMLDKFGNIRPCNSSNCGGYTLEAELGISPNGFSEPDYLGWEIKQFNVSNFNRYQSSIITLMTPEPTGGFYVNQGVDSFIFKYGYKDTKGRSDRMNFGGIHKNGICNSRTSLKLVLIGFDITSGKISNVDGVIALIDNNGNEAASWSFASLLKHWNRKHNQACYVPSLLNSKPTRRYYFGDKLILGVKTDFQLFLKEMSKGNIYYDPGIKMENISIKPVIKRRSQFRIKSQNISNLYFSNELIIL